MCLQAAVAQCPLWVKSRHSGPSTVMSALPSEQTFVATSGMSAKGQKRTLVYSINSSARASMGGGSLRPNVLAVLGPHAH